MDSHRPAKDEAILTSVAESIGATLGTIAAKAGSVQKALTDNVRSKPGTARSRKSRARRSAGTGSKKRANKGAPHSRRSRAGARRAHATKKKS